MCCPLLKRDEVKDMRFFLEWNRYNRVLLSGRTPWLSSTVDSTSNVVQAVTLCGGVVLLMLEIIMKGYKGEVI